MKKFTLLLLVASLVSSLLFACGHDIPPNEDDIPPTEFIQTEPVTAPPTESETQKETDNIDMTEIIENTYLCGTRLSNGLTWGMLEGDFSYSIEYAADDSLREKCSTDLYYKGQYLGIISFSNVPDKYSISSDTPINSIYIIERKCQINDVTPISVNGVELGDSREKVVEFFGVPDDFDRYRDKNDLLKILKFSYTDNEVGAVLIFP